MIKSYTEYQNATAWDKLKFVATAKYDNKKHVVKLEQKIYADKVRVNRLVFAQ